MTREEAKNILTSILHTDGDYMDYLDSEDVEAIKFLASDERPHGLWRFDGTDYEDGKVTGVYLSHELYELDRARFVPYRHGEWIEQDYSDQMAWATCSICRKKEEQTYNESPDATEETMVICKPFCPNCGADMRKEGDEK